MSRYICQRLLVSVTLVLMAWSPSARAAEGEGPWVQVSLGLHGMAMDDINETDFRWHEDSPDGFDLDDISSGMALAFGLGYDLSPVLGYGVFWEHQYASTSGTDHDVKADVNLAADIFSGRMNLNFIRAEKWRFGVAGSLGFLVAGGDVNKTTAGASFGKTDISGNCWALEGLASLEIVTGESTIVQLTGGWRQAKVESFDFGGVTPTVPDGGDMSMDYSGFTIRVGAKHRFGNVQGQAPPEIH